MHRLLLAELCLAQPRVNLRHWSARHVPRQGRWPSRASSGGGAALGEAAEAVKGLIASLEDLGKVLGGDVWCQSEELILAELRGLHGLVAGDAALAQSESEVAQVEAKLRYTFGHPYLLTLLFLHASATASPARAGVQKLMWLGDTVGSLVTREVVAAELDCLARGEWQARQEQALPKAHLTRVATELGLGRYVRVGRGCHMSNPGELLVAAMGAIFLDGGMLPAVDFHARLKSGALEPLGLEGSAPGELRLAAPPYEAPPFPRLADGSCRNDHGWPGQPGQGAGEGAQQTPE